MALAGRWGVTLSPEVMRLKQTINPAAFDCYPKQARFFVIKSYSEDDVHKSIKYGVWASTDTGNRRLDVAFHESAELGPMYLFFSVNASGQFCGLAQMVTPVDYAKKFGSWGQDKWNGTFRIQWTFIKDVPNAQFRHIVLANNENKPVTNSRDTQEVLPEQGREMLRIFHAFKSRTSILDDFSFYDKRQELQEARPMAQQQLQIQQQQQQQLSGNQLDGGRGRDDGAKRNDDDARHGRARPRRRRGCQRRRQRRERCPADAAVAADERHARRRRSRRRQRSIRRAWRRRDGWVRPWQWSGGERRRQLRRFSGPCDVSLQA